MVTIKVNIRLSTIEGKMGTVYYRISQHRKTRQLPTAYRVYPDEWDVARSTVASGATVERKEYIMSVREKIRRDMERLVRIARGLENSSIEYTVDDVIEEFRRYSQECTLFNFMEGVICILRHHGKTGTSLNYRYALNCFMRFRKNEDIMLDEMTSDIMTSFETWQKNRGVSLNSISFYNRILRAVYNRAVEQEIIRDRNPFRHVYTGIRKTAKRALPIAAIRKIRCLDLSLTPSLEYARDMFMLSFYLRGMSFVDMCYLLKTDLHDGYVTYRRRKTGQRLSIAWTPEMQEIVDRYPENKSRYLLPVIRDTDTAERNAYRNAEYRINRNLKKVADTAGIDRTLTMYVARHSWASAAKAKDIPLTVISEGLGHESVATTQIYLDNLDTAVVDRANSLIIADL